MKKILLLANRDFVLYNFRFELIKELLEEGNEVYIALPYGSKVEKMIDAGVFFIPLAISSRSINIFEDFKLIKDIKELYERITPDIILLYTTKADIYGGIVAGNMNIPYLLNVSGLGIAATWSGILQKIILCMYKKAVKNARCVFFQNVSDRSFFYAKRIKCHKDRLIPGSGVNLNFWKYQEYPSEVEGIHFLFIARIIKEKGIEEFLSVAKRIRSMRENVFFHVIGPCDGNYGELLRLYENSGYITYHGMVDDTRKYLHDAHCLIHPSYYPEGVSNVCLEAASSGRPVITTDNVGCKETVEDGVTGYIVPTRNIDKLIEAVLNFTSLPWKEKQKMGILARNNVQSKFDRKIVVEAYLEEISMIDG